RRTGRRQRPALEHRDARRHVELRRAPPRRLLTGGETCASNRRRDTPRVASAQARIDPAPWTFFGVPHLRDLDALEAQVAFLGVPYDGGTPQPGIPTGQRAGPEAVRSATREQLFYADSATAESNPGAEGWYDVEADRDYLVGVTMADVGDVSIQGSDTEGNY